MYESSELAQTLAGLDLEAGRLVEIRGRPATRTVGENNLVPGKFRGLRGASGRGDLFRALNADVIELDPRSIQPFQKDLFGPQVR